MCEAKCENLCIKLPCLKCDGQVSTRSVALNYCPDNSSIRCFQSCSDAALAQLLNLLFASELTLLKELNGSVDNKAKKIFPFCITS